MNRMRANIKTCSVIRNFGCTALLAAGLAGCATQHPPSMKLLGHMDTHSLKGVTKEVGQESDKLLANQKVLQKTLVSRHARQKIQPVAPKYDPLESIEVSLDLNGASIGQAFHALADQSGLNLIVDPDVLKLKERASLHLTHVTAREVFNRLLDAFNVAGTVHGNTLVVRYMQSRVFSLDFLNTSTNVSLHDGGNVFGSGSSSGSSGTTGSSSGGNELQGNFTLQSKNGKPSDSNAYDELEQMLTRLLGNQNTEAGVSGNVQELAVQADKNSSWNHATFSLNRMSGTLFVRARPDKIQSITQLINTYKQVLGRQVLIQAQLLDVTLSNNYALGVNWHLLRHYVASVVGTAPYTLSSASAQLPGAGKLPARSLVIPSQTIGGTADAPGAGLAYSKDGFAAAINALRHFGMVKVLSNPSILAKNSVPAMLSVGDTQRYISQSSVTITNPGGGAATTNADVQTNSVFSGIIVGVVPFIKQSGDVELMVHPMQTSVDQKSLALVDAGGGNKITLPKVSFKGLTTTLDIGNGDTVILGGLINQTANKDHYGVPGVSDIPYLGRLFDNKNSDRATRELIIVLKVKVV